MLYYYKSLQLLENIIQFNASHPRNVRPLPEIISWLRPLPGLMNNNGNDDV